MEVTNEMIKAFAEHYSIDMTDSSQAAGIIGSIQDWIEGRGELDGTLVDDNEIFAPVVQSYHDHKNGFIPTPPVEAPPAEEAPVEEAPEAEKLPEEEAPAT